jgi:hypothetical protein
MHKYSHFFSTLHDEQQPVGDLGRGTHCSILRAVVWETPSPRFHDFAVIWDEDHDPRVIRIIEQLYVRRLLPQILFVGERKGHVTVLTSTPTTPKYQQQVEGIAGDLPSDSFSSSVEVFSAATSLIIDAEEGRVRAYLAGLAALWSLGAKDVQFTTAGFLGERTAYAVSSKGKTPQREPELASP